MTSQSSPIFDPFYLPSIQELQTAFPLAESFPTRSTEFPWLNPNFTKTQFKLNNYQVYTQEFIASLGSYLLKRGLPVLEVGAGDGRLTYFLKQQCGDAVSIIATDIKDWEEKGQTNASQDVEKLGYLEAIEKYATVPTLILSCWMNVDVNWTADFRAQPNIKEYILIGDVFRTGGYGAEWYLPENSGFVCVPLTQSSDAETPLITGSIGRFDGSPFNPESRTEVYSFRRAE